MRSNIYPTPLSLYGDNLNETTDKESGNGDSARIEGMYEPQPIQIYGIWAYKIDGKVDYTKPFPPRNLEDKIKLLSMMPGEKHSLKDINTNWLKQALKDGMTHLMLGHGDSCQVKESKDIQEYLDGG